MVEHPTLNSCYDKDLAVEACRSDAYFRHFVVRISSNTSSKCNSFYGVYLPKQMGEQSKICLGK